MKIKELLIKILEIISIIIFIVITLTGSYQVFSRYVLNRPQAWTEEVLTLGFTWLSLLAASYVFGKREHMRLTFFIDKFSKKIKNKIEIVIEFTIMLFSLSILVFGGLKICLLTMDQITPALQISTGLAYSIVPISGIIIVVFNIININLMIKNMGEV